MQKIRLVALAAAVLVSVYCGVAYSAPSLNGDAAGAVPAQGKAAGPASVISAGGSAVPGGMTLRPGAKPGLYTVRTVWKDAPLTKVRVEWHRQIEEPSPAYVGETIRVGTANFRPATGAYYLTADWRADGDFTRPRRPGDLFAWYGGNPLLVSSESSETITLMLEEVPAPPSPPVGGTGIFGRVTLGGAPAANVGVYAYATAGSGFKGDDFSGLVRSNAKGEFTLDLPPGRYYLLARLRGDNSVDIGPLHKEDLLGYESGNPVAVVADRYTAAAIPAARLKMVKTRAESSVFQPGVIEGRIVDGKGRPVKGAYGALYDKASMTGRSVFRSDPTGLDGTFRLSVPIPGTYYLGARSGYGTPHIGAWFGAWGGNADHTITIRSGEVRSGIEIVVERTTREVKPSGSGNRGTGGATGR